MENNRKKELVKLLKLNKRVKRILPILKKINQQKDGKI